MRRHAPLLCHMPSAIGLCPARNLSVYFGAPSLRVASQILPAGVFCPKPPLRFAAIAQALQSPLEIRISRSDKTAQLFYEYHARTRVGGKWLCIVVKYPSADGFVVTAYLTDRVKEGETIWPTK